MSAYNKFDTQAFLEGEGEGAVAQIKGFEPAATEPLGKQILAPQTFAAFAAFAMHERRNAKAERCAFEAAVINWMNSNAPVNPDLNKCVSCGKSLGRIGQDSVPVLSGNGAHVWLHHGCHGDWMAQRRAEAVQALAGLGLTPPDRTEA
jgi:hypothetical protein